MEDGKDNSKDLVKVLPEVSMEVIVRGYNWDFSLDVFEVRGVFMALVTYVTPICCFIHSKKSTKELNIGLIS